MDESGNTGTRLDDPDQPVHYLAAIGVEENQVNPLEAAFRDVVLAYLPEAWQDGNFEIKGQSLRKGSGFFKKLPPTRRIALTHQLLDLLAQFQVQVFFEGMIKASSIQGEHPHQSVFMYLAVQINLWLKKQMPQALGLLIADEQDEMEQALIDFVLWGKTRKSVVHAYESPIVMQIVDSVHFVRSTNNVLIQLADLVAFVINRGLRSLDLKSTAHLADASLFEKVQRRVVAGHLNPIKKPTKVDDDSGSVTQTHS